MDAFHLAPRPDQEALTARLASTSRVHIPDIFPADIAQSLWATLSNETDWALSVQGIEDMKRTQIAALTLPQLEQAARVVEENARKAFYYVYDTLRVADCVTADQHVADGHMQLYRFLNSPAFLDFARALTGDQTINYVDMQATRYRPGHFLMTHTDDKEGKDRRFAYVFNFTPKWRPDWGGILLFTDANGDVIEGFTPAFNALNILKVPQPHSVSMVSPSAAGARYSFTGWMRAVEAPPRIPEST